jgi:hypothetical protein
MLLNSKYELSMLANCRTASNPLEEFNGGLILSASWETRSQEILKYLDFGKITNVILVRYENQGKTKISGNIRNKIRDLCSKHKILIREIVLESVKESHAHYHHAVYSIAEIMNEKGGKWAIDISSMPRRLWCSLICLLDTLNITRHLLFNYSHPKYISTEDSYRQVFYEHTIGEWRLQDIPFSKIVFSSGLYKKNIISTGFEYDKLKAIMYKHETDHNSIICASPGFSDEYTKIADRTAAMIRSAFEIRESDIYKVGVTDIEGVVKIACKLIDENSDKDVSLICAGNKLHSLALCLASLCYSDVNFFVRVPMAYRENTTPTTGEYDIISLENLFAAF